MSTTLMWKALDTHGRIYSKIWNYPIYWNTKIGGLSFENDPKKLAVWYFVTFGVVLFTIVGSCALLFGMWIFYNKPLPLLNAGIFAALICVCIFICCISYAVTCHGKSTAKAFNQLRVIEKQLNKRN